MRAELAKREPERVAWWRDERVYERRLERNAGGRQWILHDGPPYANGDVHMGGFLNRVLKDIFVKMHLLDGAYAKFVPGWDMHGLPIEFETLRHLGIDFHQIDPVALRAACRERALYWLDRQRETFLRMGLLGDYEHPYRTIDPDFEATIIDTLADLAQARQLYRGLRATLWCIRDETALAEAEIEYKERVSPSIYVRFLASSEQRSELLLRTRADLARAAGLPLSIVVWTTTPWTLPANVAIAVRADAAYGVYRRGEELLVVADERAADVFAQGDDGPSERIGGASGTDLVGAGIHHPLFERDSLVVSADYVALDTGTGAVHTAPGHGADDFETGRRFGLPILSPVDAAGRFTEDAGPYAGQGVFAANDRIIADLQQHGALFAQTRLEHSYPHCWRCKQPVIFRATSQWFIAMDANRLRKRIEERIGSVAWVPAWGEHRMLQMVENHPEWCISRQRTWGTPIPALACQTCGEIFLDSDVARRVAAVLRERGSEAVNASDLWWTQPLEDFLPENFACPQCNGRAFEKRYDIVDIWFESGVTHRAVLEPRGMHWPADLYLEGSDQYRGWFRSNLVTAVATRGAAPYKTAVSTGWVLDADGRAMHKSAGNYIAAADAMATYGADVLRLWVASVEFTADMRFGSELLEAIGKVYRNWRNRLRMLLGLIEDLRSDELLPREQLAPIDRLALAKLDDVAYNAIEHYQNYRLHDVYLALLDYDATDLSSFYVDLLKDPMYSGERTGGRRKSAQTALFTILQTLCALLAPLLSFTAEEAWQFVSEDLRGERTSVFDLALPRGSARGTAERAELELWEMLKTMRTVVAASDGPRDFQLQAQVRASVSDEARLRPLGDNLREVLVVSALDLGVDANLRDGDAPRIQLAAADGAKCSRCWKYLRLGDDPLHPTLCRPCAAIVRKSETTG